MNIYGYLSEYYINDHNIKKELYIVKLTFLDIKLVMFLFQEAV